MIEDWMHYWQTKRYRMNGKFNKWITLDRYENTQENASKERNRSISLSPHQCTTFWFVAFESSSIPASWFSWAIHYPLTVNEWSHRQFWPPSQIKLVHTTTVCRELPSSPLQLTFLSLNTKNHTFTLYTSGTAIKFNQNSAWSNQDESVRNKLWCWWWHPFSTIILPSFDLGKIWKNSRQSNQDTYFMFGARRAHSYSFSNLFTVVIIIKWYDDSHKTITQSLIIVRDFSTCWAHTHTRINNCLSRSW